MYCTESELIERLKKSKKVLLIEPNYKRKYIPLGLAKISTFVKQNGGTVVYKRSYEYVGEDLICITSLFTYDSQKVFDVLDDIYGSVFYKRADIIVGGVFASLMPKIILSKYPEVNVFVGYSEELDMCCPDYSVDWGINEPWDKYSFVFTSRGCPNRCPYCAVWRIEPAVWINPLWKNSIVDKPNIMISDNNLSSQPMDHIKDVCNFSIENNKKIIFDNGFDCKHITDEMAILLSKLKFDRAGMRLAFDRIEEDGIFQIAIEKLKNHGISKSSIMACVLFNFNDTPREANYRMSECVRLGIRPYPQQYTPLNKLSRDTTYIGKHWTKNLVRSFRFFWLMAGYYGKMTFEDFVNSEVGKKYKLSEEDFESWNK